MSEVTNAPRYVYDNEGGTIADGDQVYYLSDLPAATMQGLALRQLGAIFSRSKETPDTVFNRLASGKSGARSSKKMKSADVWREAAARVRADELFAQADGESDFESILSEQRSITAQWDRSTLTKVRRHPLIALQFANLSGETMSALDIAAS